MTTIEEVQMKIQRMLQSWLGTVQIDSDGDFIFPLDSTKAYGSVFDWGDDDFLFRVWATVLLDVPLTNELYRFVATESYDLGGLVLHEKEGQRVGTLIFDYTILANDLDPSELKKAVSVVASTADNLVDKLLKRFGGSSFGDA